MTAVKQKASRDSQEDEFGLYALRDASLRRLQGADNDQARMGVERMLSAVWDAIRKLINAVLRALGLKQSRAAAGDPIGAQAQDLHASLTAAKSASQAGLPSERDERDLLGQALDHCGFDVFQQSLLRQLHDPQCKDHEVIGRMLGPVLSAAAGQLALFDQKLDGQRAELVALGAKVINILGGPPLTLADALRIGRQGQGVQWPAEQAQAMQALLSHDALVSQACAQRELISDALAAFAWRAKEGGADLVAHERELRVVLGPQWQERCQAAADQPNAQEQAQSQAQSGPVVLLAPAPAPAGARPTTARELLRAAALRASSPEDVTFADVDDDDEHHVRETAQSTERLQ